METGKQPQNLSFSPFNGEGYRDNFNIHGIHAHLHFCNLMACAEMAPYN